MDEKLNTDLNFKYSSVSLSSNNPHGDKEVFNFNYDVDSQFEDLLLDIKDQEDNLLQIDEEYDLTEEQENYFLRDDCTEHYIKRNGLILWNYDINDFTVEQENHLLGEYCTEHYIESLGICNLSKVYTVDDENKLLFVDVSPSVNQSKECTQKAIRTDIIQSSNSKSSDGKKRENLSILADKDIEITRDLSTIPTQHIKSKDLLHNSGTFSHLKDNVETQKIVTNSDGENITEKNTSDNEDEEFFKNRDDESNSQSLCNDSFTVQNMPMGSSTSEGDKFYPSEEPKADERVPLREFDVSKIMECDCSRRAYLNLLKNKTRSLSRSYEKYKSGFLENPWKSIEELELGESFKKEKNLPTKFSNHQNKKEVKFENETFKHQPLNIATERKNDENADEFNNLWKSSVEKIKRKLDSIKYTDVEDFRQLQKIEGTFFGDVTTDSNDRYIKDSADKITSGAFLEEKAIYNTGRLYFYNPTKYALELKDWDISEAFSKEQKLKVKMKVASDLKKSVKPNQFSMTKEDIGEPDRKIFNKTLRNFPGSVPTEILRRHSFVGYEVFQPTNDDSDMVADEIDATHSELKSKKRRKLRQAPAVSRTNYNPKTLRKKCLKSSVNSQILLDLFTLNNKIATSILSALLSDQFKKGALLTDIMKYIRREMSLKIASKLRQDIQTFLKAAVETGIVQMKNRRYFSTRERKRVFWQK